MAEQNQAEDLKFKQIAVAQYTSNNGKMTYTVVALGEDGHVYQSKDDKWVRFENRFDGYGPLKSAPRQVHRDSGHTSDPGEPPW